jgi:hypothetical protein
MGFWDDTRANRVRIPKVQAYQWKLDLTANVTLDATGAATTQLSPAGAREKWSVNFVAVNTVSPIPNSIKVPTMIMYRSAAVPGNQLGGTFSANMDTDSTDTYNLNMNEPIVFQWTNGDPGSAGKVHIEGIRYVWE